MRRAVLVLLLVTAASPRARAAGVPAAKPAPAQVKPAASAPATPAAPSAAPARSLPLVPPAPKLPDRTALEALLAETDAIAKTVSSVRGLALKRPLVRGIMSRPEIEARVRLRLEEEYRPTEMLAEELALKRLGLLPADMGYKEAVLALLKDQIAGFYDPKAKQLYLADWIEASFQRMVMAHEIAHVLQDQHFDLQKYAPTNKANADEQLARQAVVEGDGIAVMIEVMAREQGSTGDPWASPDQARALVKMMEAGEGGTLGEAPLLLRESLVFPYAAGLKLVAELRRTLPWARLNDLYRRPPRSTEQVMHPEKWQRGEQPVPVLALKAPAGARVLYTNIFGELLTSVFLRQHGVSEPRARAAAAGWGGDRVQVFAPTTGDAPVDDLVVVWRSAWDTEADAVEVLEPLGEALEALVGTCSMTREIGARCGAPGGDVALIERRGTRVIVVVGAPSTVAADKQLKDAWVGFAPRAPLRELPPGRP